jgi:hypothetical protein
VGKIILYTGPLLLVVLIVSDCFFGVGRLAKIIGSYEIVVIDEISGIASVRSKVQSFRIRFS